MLYLLCCLVLMLVACKRMIGWMLHRIDSNASSVDWRSSLISVVLPVGIALAVIAPVLNTFMDGAAFASGTGMSMSSGNVSVCIALAGAFAGVALYGAAAVSASKAGPFALSRSLRFGAPLGCAVAILVITGIQLEFALHEDAGFVNLGFVRDQVNDMNCDSDVVLARWNQSETTPVIYRCPHEIALNSFSTTPFLPWPSYHQGESSDLAKAMGKVLESSK